MLNTLKLKGRMIECQVTQRDLASTLNLAPATVSLKINGFRPMNLIEAAKVAKKLNIKSEDLSEYFFSQKNCAEQNSEATTDNLTGK